jgi:hypothetical protein
MGHDIGDDMLARKFLLSSAMLDSFLGRFSASFTNCPRGNLCRDDVLLKSPVLPQSDVTDIRVTGAANSYGIRSIGRAIGGPIGTDSLLDRLVTYIRVWWMLCTNHGSVAARVFSLLSLTTVPACWEVFRPSSSVRVIRLA